MWRCLCLAVAFIAAACAAQAQQARVEVRDYPLVPIELVERNRGIIPLRGAFPLQDRQHPLVTYTADGEPDYQIYNAIIFPVDLLVVLTPEMESPKVFLARSPHGGCIMKWEHVHQRFADPCYGSLFSPNGDYLFGPAEQSLDELPSEVRGQMIWVRNQIVYGEPHEGYHDPHQDQELEKFRFYPG